MKLGIDRRKMSKIPGLDKTKFGMLDEVRDTVSGYTGKVTGVTMYLNGCLQYSVSRAIDPEDKGGGPKSYWIDEEQLELLKSADAGIGLRATGGPTSQTRRGE